MLTLIIRFLKHPFIIIILHCLHFILKLFKKAPASSGFIASAKFNGLKDGYVFSKGEYGNGYYPDVSIHTFNHDTNTYTFNTL